MEFFLTFGFIEQGRILLSGCGEKDLYRIVQMESAARTSEAAKPSPSKYCINFFEHKNSSRRHSSDEKDGTGITYSSLWPAQGKSSEGRWSRRRHGGIEQRKNFAKGAIAKLCPRFTFEGVTLALGLSDFGRLRAIEHGVVAIAPKFDGGPMPDNQSAEQKSVLIIRAPLSEDGFASIYFSSGDGRLMNERE